MANCKVFVGSLPLGTKPKELRHLFQNYGIVIECDIMNRCGFVHMETSEMAETAILGLHGSEFKGQMIVVEPGRQKEEQNPKKNAAGSPPADMLCDSSEHDDSAAQQHVFDSGNSRGAIRDRNSGPRMRGGPNRGMTNRGNMFHRGGESPYGMSNRSATSYRGGMETSFGMQNRSGMSNRGIQNRRGIGSESNMPTRGSFKPRGGMNSNRDMHNNPTEDDIGPMRNNSNFKQRPTPYTAATGDGFRGRKFLGNQRRGYDNSHRQNTRFSDNGQQEQGNWHPRRDNGNKPHQSSRGDANFIDELGSGNGRNHNIAGSSFRGGRGNRIPHNNIGQDRRGFTLDNTQQQFGGPPNERNAFRDNDQRSGDNYQRRPYGSVRGGPQRGRGGFSRGRGGGDGRNFSGSIGQDNTYNTEFPALGPSRGRGSFAGHRGGFNRNASQPRQNMMPNRR